MHARRQALAQRDQRTTEVFPGIASTTASRSCCQYVGVMLALSISGDISRKRHCGTTSSGWLCRYSRIRASKPDAGARPLALACMPMVPPV
jgi:hypothetical protein